MKHAITQNATLQIRQEMLEGKAHLVAPVVLLTEGVHSGSGGPLYYSNEELAKFPEAWNGVPITVPHPSVNGVGVSANSPEILEQFAVGRLFNVSFDTKLRGEVWVDVEKCTRISPVILSYLQSSGQLEVSTGLFTEDIPVSGTWNDENYVAVATNFRPDHLALLPGSRGACSWEDGCGLRTNTQKGATMIKQLAALYVGNETSYEERVGAVSSAIDMLDNEMAYHYSIAVYDDHVIYRKSPNSEHNPSGRRMTLRRGYTIDGNGAVALSESVEEVREERTFVPVANEACACKGRRTINNNEKEKGDTTMVTISPERASHVNSLLAKNAGWTENHRAFLESIDDANFAAIDHNSTAVTSAPQLNSAADVLAIVPEVLREQFAEGIKLHAEAKDKTIASIMAHVNNKFTKEQLEVKSNEELGSIAALITPAANTTVVETATTTDFSVQGLPPVATTNTETKVEPLQSPKLNWDNPKK